MVLGLVLVVAALVLLVVLALPQEVRKVDSQLKVGMGLASSAPPTRRSSKTSSRTRS
jgi:predicted secreted protein